ncbi:hypothetical protein [Bradyrhizobium sp. UFLA05-112]
MLIRRIALVLSLALGTTQAMSAQDAAFPLNRQAMQEANNLAHEHLICAAYANIVAACMIMKNGERDPTGQRYKEVGGALMERGFRIGEVAGVSFNASKARLEMAHQEMTEKIEKSCSNISILLQEHMNACVTLHNEGPDRLRAIVAGK